MSHTSGPFIVIHFAERDGLKTKREGFSVIAPHRGVCIATTPTTGTMDGHDSAEGPSLVELRANADLLAAAPKMLAALKEAVEMVPPSVAVGLRKVIAQAEPRR
jgi:hypothetical protein